MATSNSSMIGANLGGDSDGATALFAVGSKTTGTDDSEWIYVQANVALTTGQCLSINSTFTAVLAHPAADEFLAFSQGVFTAADFGWVATRGNPIYVLVSGVSTVGGAVFLSEASGTLSVVASGTLAGISVIEVTATATAGAKPAFVTYPRPQVTTGGGRG